MRLIEISTFLIEFIGVSSILYLVYILTLRYKSQYNLVRIYLLLTPIVALLGATLTFNVIPTKVQNIERSSQVQHIKNLFLDLNEDVKATSSTHTPRPMTATLSEVVVPTEMPIIVESQTFKVPELTQESNTRIASTISIVSILGLAYILVILIRASSLSYQVHKIRSIKRWATIEEHNGVQLYRSALVETPFSFMRDIFIDRAVHGDKLRMIIQHELSHITNRHYIDKNIAELMCIFMWFNPIVWLIRKELCSTHEFQADNNVIKNGANIKTYQNYLFEEILSKSPIIANGFNHSLIKKRMIMMKNRKTFKHIALRASIAATSLVGAFVLVSFKYAEADNSPKDKVSENSPKKANDIVSNSNEGEISVKTADNTTSKGSVVTSSKNNKAAPEQFFTTYTVSDSLKKESPEATLRYRLVPKDTHKEIVITVTAVAIPSSNNIIINILHNKKNSNLTKVLVTGDTTPSDEDIATLVDIFGKPEMIGDPMSELILAHLLKKDGVQREARGIKVPTNNDSQIAKVTLGYNSKQETPTYKSLRTQSEAAIIRLKKKYPEKTTSTKQSKVILDTYDSNEEIIIIDEQSNITLLKLGINEYHSNYANFLEMFRSMIIDCEESNDLPTLVTLRKLFIAEEKKAAKQVKSRYDDPEKYYTLSDAQINPIPEYMKSVKIDEWRSYNGQIIGMEVTENSTLVDIVLRPGYDVYWWCMSQNTCLIDKKTGKQYKIKGIKGGMPLEELLIVKGYNNKYICFTLVFAPLDAGVKRVDFVEKNYETLVPPSNGSPMIDRNLDVKKLQRRKLSGATSTPQIFNDTRSHDYTLKEDQINGLPDYIIFDKDSRSELLNERAIGIETNETQTLVDFVIRPSNNAYWFGVSENTYLVDHKTGNRYKIRAIKGDIPLGKGLVVKGQENNDLCFTFIFPPLGDKVKKIDLIELVSETMLSPTDGVQLFHNINLNVKDLVEKKNKMGKIIK